MHNLGDYAQHMLALMDYLNVDMFSIVGLSAGGMWGAELAVLAPTRVTSLVLLDTFVGLEPEVAFNKYKVMLDSVDDLQKIPEAIRSSVLALSYSERVRHDKPELIGQLDELLVDVKGDQARQLAAIGRMVFGRRDLCEEVEKLALPTLIAVGDQDKPTPVLEAYLMNDLISGSEINVIPNSGHLSVVEQPEYVTVMLEAFFSKHLS
jgi:pimeloyl-ACP methyl ester carboxylesterase